MSPLPKEEGKNDAQATLPSLIAEENALFTVFSLLTILPQQYITILPQKAPMLVLGQIASLMTRTYVHRLAFLNPIRKNITIRC